MEIEIVAGIERKRLRLPLEGGQIFAANVSDREIGKQDEISFAGMARFFGEEVGPTSERTAGGAFEEQHGSIRASNSVQINAVELCVHGVGAAGAGIERRRNGLIDVWNVGGKRGIPSLGVWELAMIGVVKVHRVANLFEMNCGHGCLRGHPGLTERRQQQSHQKARRDE